MKKETCNCRLCERSRAFKKHLATVNDQEAKKFFEHLYGEMWDVEEENECLKSYQDNLKRIYPKIYREMHTLEKLEKGNEQFPEINI